MVLVPFAENEQPKIGTFEWVRWGIVLTAGDTTRALGSTSVSHQVREQESRVHRPESLGALPLLHDARDVPLAAPLPDTVTTRQQAPKAEQHKQKHGVCVKQRYGNVR